MCPTDNATAGSLGRRRAGQLRFGFVAVLEGHIVSTIVYFHKFFHRSSSKSDNFAWNKKKLSTALREPYLYDLLTVLECRELLNKLGAKNRITLSWIKAHAKSGTTQGGIGPWPHEPASHFQNNLLTKINARCNGKRNGSRTQHFANNQNSLFKMSPQT
jgi:hypothetical protein